MLNLVEILFSCVLAFCLLGGFINPFQNKTQFLRCQADAKLELLQKHNRPGVGLQHPSLFDLLFVCQVCLVLNACESTVLYVAIYTLQPRTNQAMLGGYLQLMMG